MTGHARRAMLALLVLLLALPAAPARSQAPEAPASAPMPGLAASAAATPARIVLVVVTGNGAPLVNAEVQFKAEGHAEKTMRTDLRGEVSYLPPAVAKLRVRVLARGWSAHFGDLALPVAGDARFEVAMEPGVSPE